MNGMGVIGNLFSQSVLGKTMDHTRDAQLWKEQTRLRTRDDMIALSKEARKALSHMLKRCKDTDHGETKLDPKLMLIKTIIASFIRQAVKEIRFREFSSIAKDTTALALSGQRNNSDAAQYSPTISLDAHYLYAETKSASFTLNGVIKTTDDQEITFEVDLNVERTLLVEKEISIESGDGDSNDQVVVDFEGTAAQLTNFSFELDLEIIDSNEDPSRTSKGRGNVRFGTPAKQLYQIDLEVATMKSSIFSYSYKDGNAGSTQYINMAL